MDPFYGPGGRRAILPEIEAHIGRQIGATVVNGFAEMLDAGDALAGSERIAGFQERSDHREWLLRISAGRGMAWQTARVPGSTAGHVAFSLALGFGNGSPLPQPSGRWDVYVNDRFAVSIRVVNHSQLWQSGECRLAFAANRVEAAEPYAALHLSSLIQNEAFATFGPGLLVVPSTWVVHDAPTVVRVEPCSEYPSQRWFQINPGPGVLANSDVYRAVDLLNGGRHPRVREHNVYFGDIHTHSGQVLEQCENRGCGMGTQESNYVFARGAGGLDFYSLTDHEWQIDPAKVDAYLDLADRYNENGCFVCLPGFEHTSLIYGHRNIYWRGSGGTVVNAARDWGRPTLEPDKALNPQELWPILEATGVPFLSIPHHTSSTSWPFTPDLWHPQHDRLVEVYSSWGSSEYYGDFPRGVSDRWHTLNVRAMLRDGLRCGLIGSSDGHDGHPGDAQSPVVKHHHIFHFLGSGRAAVLAPELTRAAVFDALYARRCYATTGVPIVLDVTLNGAEMGAQLPALAAGQRPQLSMHCAGASSLDHIRIMKDARVVETIPCHGEDTCDLEWEDAHYDPQTPASYYVRAVQRDRESAWSSPIWLG